MNDITGEPLRAVGTTAEHAAPRLPAPPTTSACSRVLGTGLDLVHVPGLADQLALPGTVLAERAFTARERREARRRAEAGSAHQAEHLAARWAAKEAFVKAWSQAVSAVAGAAAPVLAPEAVDWRDIEFVSDRWGRPSLCLGGQVARRIDSSLGAGSSASARWPVSVTHDGDYAAAIVLALAP